MPRSRSQGFGNLTQSLGNRLVDGIGLDGREPGGDVGDEPLEAQMLVVADDSRHSRFRRSRDVENRRNDVP